LAWHLRGEHATAGSRLCSIGQFDPQEWKFPPKSNGMRWKTYDHYEEKFDKYEGDLNDSLFAKLGGL